MAAAADCLSPMLMSLHSRRTADQPSRKRQRWLALGASTFRRPSAQSQRQRPRAHLGTVWPRACASARVTETLTRGYWPSYNVPYFPEVYKRSGYDREDVQRGLGDDASYELAPRAKIFRRDQATVTDMTTFKRIMRYNNYLKDPYSLDDGKPDAADAICVRTSDALGV